MVFANGKQSPFFETKGAEKGEIAKSFTIDTEKEIRLVSMKVDSGLYYHGIRLRDKDN